MLIKLGIIAGIVILGGMVFSNEINTLFPSTSAAMFDSLKDDLTSFGSNATDSVEKRIDKSIDKITNSTSNAITNQITKAGDKVTDEISEVKDSSQKTITEQISNLNPIESIKNIFTDSNSKTTKYTPTFSQSNSETQNNTPLTFETLSLSTQQQSDDDILLRYSDSSQKTKSVQIVLRTEQKELFSGTFFSSMFETTVNDATDVPYFIDMTVDHEDHGTITSSVYNPGDASDTNINGVFLQS